MEADWSPKEFTSRGRPRSRVSQWCSQLASVALPLIALACHSTSEDRGAAATAGAAGAANVATAPGAAGAPNASQVKAPKAAPPWRIPVGPRLAILPGKGFGPIRFGAHVDTIERLLGEACEEKREQEGGTLLCRYSAHAVDFVLKDGAVIEMRAHRLDRPFAPERKLNYGIFNGRFEEGVSFGMVPNAVQEMLGKPKTTRPVEGENPNHTVEVYEYDNITLEFDRISPNSVVLGGVIMKAPPPGKELPGDKPAAPTPAPKTPKSSKNPKT